MGRSLLLTIAAVVALTIACGSSPDTSGDSPTLAAGSETPELATPEGDGLALRLTGTVVEGSLCPGGQRPCLPMRGEELADTETPVQVVGLLADGVLEVTDHGPAPTDERDLSDRCEGLTPAGNGGDDPVDVALSDYQRTIPESLAIVWVSPTNVFHLGVVGDAEPHRQALAERDLGDRVCVVAGFIRTEAELQDLSAAISPVVEGWQADGFDDSLGWGADPFAGTVAMDAYRIDAEKLADLEELGAAIEVRAAIEVLDGTIADLDEALAVLASSGPAPQITVTCGPVVFDSVPADVDGFPPVDDEATAALDAAATGPIGVEAESFVTGNDWSIASRTDDEMILFGSAGGDGADGAGSYAHMRFERAGEEWSVQGFGGCSLSVEAPGFGPASVSLDPERRPDPESTELPVLINERACASGRAPTDREIVPVITETDTTVELAVLVAPVKGGAECPGNPWHPITVTLDAPLGDRTVLDGSVQPAEPRDWPPAQTELDG